MTTTAPLVPVLAAEKTTEGRLPTPARTTTTLVPAGKAAAMRETKATAMLERVERVDRVDRGDLGDLGARVVPAGAVAQGELVELAGVAVREAAEEPVEAAVPGEQAGAVGQVVLVAGPLARAARTRSAAFHWSASMDHVNYSRSLAAIPTRAALPAPHARGSRRAFALLLHVNASNRRAIWTAGS